MSAQYIHLIQKVLSPDLLAPDQRRRLTSAAHPTTGHCYTASEVLYHIYGRTHGYRPHVLRVGDNTHWFLKDAQGRVLDPTAEQFSTPVSYAEGRACGYLTGNKPSKRCLAILSRMGISHHD